MALGFWAGYAWLTREAVRQGYTLDFVDKLTLVILLSSLAGARTLYVILEWNEFRGDLISIVRPPCGGFVFYGGFVAALACTFIYLRREKTSVWEIGDLIAPALVLGQAVGRWGCYFNGCCFGSPIADILPWGMLYPENAPASLMYGSHRLHPSPIYESLGCLAIFFLLRRLARTRAFPGQVLWSYTALYGTMRFLLEFLRGDDRGFTLYALSPSQWTGLVMVPLGLLMLWRLGRVQRRA